MNPGLYPDIDIRAYHSGPGISKSGLDDLNRSPAIYKALRGPDAPPREETSSQLHGNLAHCAILEPAQFFKRYAVAPVMNRNTNKWKEIVAACPAGMTPIQEDQADIAMKQTASVRALQNVFEDFSMAEVLATGRPELSAYWTDEETGVLCRCRPDWEHELPDGSVLLLDIKTYGNASAREFGKQVGRMRYYVQDSFYSMGYEKASGKRVAGFVFVAVEDKFPFASASYMLGEETRYEGFAESRRLIDLYVQCQRTGIWPGYGDRSGVIDLPPYMLNSSEVEVSYVE